MTDDMKYKHDATAATTKPNETESVNVQVSINKAVEELSEDVATFWCPSQNVPRLDAEPTPLEFMREYVARSVPCIIPYHGPGIGLTLDDIVDIVENEGNESCMISVDVTPDGYGDCVRPVKVEKDGVEVIVDMFVEPEQRQMPISEFRSKLRKSCESINETQYQTCRSPSHETLRPVSLWQGADEGESINFRQESKGRNEKLSNCVFYYSKQNDCLRTELKHLYDCNFFPESVPFAEQAFGPNCYLEAVNLWMGNERSVSSMHKDYYENIFIVLSGEKIFTLCPPSDALFIPEEEFLSARFRNLNNVEDNVEDWIVEANIEEYINDKLLQSKVTKAEQATVKWIKPDISCCTNFDKTRYPLLSHTHPIEVRVKAGEMVYLPSLWLHKVTQSCETIGINFWYDMRFDDPKWCYLHFMHNIRDQLKVSK